MNEAREPIHPSLLALDRAALGAGTDDTTRHLETCDRCRAHVRQVGTPSTVAPLRRAVVKRPRPIFRRVLTLAGATAVVAAALLFLVLDRGTRELADPAEPTYDTVKGARAVGVYVKRARRTFLWNGSDAIIPGDTLRLKIVPEGLGQVNVFSEAVGPTGARDLVLLHRGALPPGRDALLPAAWQVDDAGDREVLVVVLSRTPLDLESARAAARGGTGADRWVARITLPKRAAP